MEMRWPGNRVERYAPLYSKAGGIQPNFDIRVSMSVKVRPLPKLTGSDHIRSVKVGLQDNMAVRWIIMVSD